MERDFKGIWIPKEIWLSQELTLQEKVFLVEIQSLDREQGCYANNEYFANFFGISKVRVSEVINSLVEKGFIKSEINMQEGNKRILKTLANFSLRPSQTFLEDPHKLFFKHNNTVNNTKNNIPASQAQQALKIFNEVYATYNPKAIGLAETNTRLRMISNREREFKKAFTGRDFLKACRVVFEYKAKEWFNTDMWKYFTIETMMRESHFVKYCEEVINNKGTPPEPKPKQKTEEVVVAKSAFKNFVNGAQEE